MPCITLENGSYVAESLNSEKLVILNKSDSSNISDPVPSGHVLVPNIIHYIRWNNPEYSFNDYVCFRSAYLNHKPNMFYIHTNTNFTGKYWNKVTEELKWTEKIKIVWLEPPTHIFGQKMDRGFLQDLDQGNAVLMQLERE
ncbi:hypothetical protein QYM36_019726 [Artemia franciscana]|uniref:Uncharacterized protein n=1 Tax=Artemia franciscana TaxID=6661 RepID=A0AA88H0W4_ARTSF|nr:hypothetical protein QYM36_019726 [Artemia franciscana]